MQEYLSSLHHSNCFKPEAQCFIQYTKRVSAFVKQFRWQGQSPGMVQSCYKLFYLTKHATSQTCLVETLVQRRGPATFFCDGLSNTRSVLERKLYGATLKPLFLFQLLKAFPGLPHAPQLLPSRATTSSRPGRLVMAPCFWTHSDEAAPATNSVIFILFKSCEEQNRIKPAALQYQP